MTKDTYIKAKRLIEDIEAIDKQIQEVERKNHWITTSTPDNQLEGAFSYQFQKDLINWLKQTREKYQKEFDELN